MHDSAVARRRPRSRQSWRTSSATVRSSSANRWRRSGSRSASTSSSARALGARLDDEIDVDLEVPRADRRLHPGPVPARLRERAGDRRLAGAVEAEHSPPGRRRPCEDGLERARFRPRRARGGAARRAAPASRRTHSAPRRARAPARCRRSPRRPRPPGRSPAWSPRGRNRRTGGRAARRPRATRPRCAPRARRRRGEARPPPARRARRCDRRASARARPRRGRRRPRSPLAAPPSRSVWLVAHDHDPLRLEAQRERLARVERPVAVGSLAPHELAARDDDRRAGAVTHPLTAVAPDTVSRPLGCRA